MHDTQDADHLACSLANQRALVRFAWIFGFGLALSLGVPDFFFAVTISSFTALAAGLMATLALFARDSVFAPHLSRWDVAAALYAVSLFTGFFVDLETLRLQLMLYESGLR